MNKDELKGKLQNLKGRMKHAAGSLTGDKGSRPRAWPTGRRHRAREVRRGAREGR